MKNDPTIKPLSPRKAVEHPRYSAALLKAAGDHLSKVPPDLCGRQIVSLLSFGSAADIAAAGVLLWDKLPLARDAAHRIDVAARTALALEEFHAARAKAAAPAPEPCPLTEAIKAAGIPVPPPDVLAHIKRVVGIKPGDKIEVTRTEPAPAQDEDEDKSVVDQMGDMVKAATQDDDHGLTLECFIALQRVLPGIRVVQRKVISCPTLPVEIAQSILDMTLAKAKRIGLL